MVAMAWRDSRQLSSMASLRLPAKLGQRVPRRRIDCQPASPTLFCDDLTTVKHTRGANPARVCAAYPTAGLSPLNCPLVTSFNSKTLLRRDGVRSQLDAAASGDSRNPHARWQQLETLAGLTRINLRLVAKEETVDSPHRVVLGMDRTEIPVCGRQEQSASNGHFESTCWLSLFLFTC